MADHLFVINWQLRDFKFFCDFYVISTFQVLICFYKKSVHCYPPGKLLATVTPVISLSFRVYKGCCWAVHPQGNWAADGECDAEDTTSFSVGPCGSQS